LCEVDVGTVKGVVEHKTFTKVTVAVERHTDDGFAECLPEEIGATKHKQGKY
jgi:hypothetical protein